jgi:cyclopropane fatty-acyl-phospholipid synthase-like methyltransferase
MKNYWDIAAKDPDVDVKYICDIDTELCLKDIYDVKGKVLEIGCGVGRLMKDGWLGVDISNGMIEIARKRKPNCEFYNLDHLDTMKDNQLDYVYMYLLIQHLKPNQVKDYFAVSKNLLRQKGCLVFQFIQGTEREPLSNHYSIAEIDKIASDTGFKNRVCTE